VTQPDPNPLALVADSSRDVRRTLQRLLERHGCRTLAAGDGEELVASAIRQRPDLILLDAGLPRPDGFAAVRALKAHPETAHIPIILLTSLGGPDATQRGLEAGADEFLAKPCDEYELVARVRAVLRVKQQQDRLRDHQERLRLLLRVTEQLRLQVDAQALSESIATLAGRHLGFGRVVVNLLDPASGLLKVTAVVGVLDPKARAGLLRTTYRWADVQALLRPAYQVSESFLIPDERGADRRARRHGDTPVGDRWQREDNLLVPLRSAEGVFFGLLSFDTPADGLRPGVEQIQMLELFAHQAAVALQTAAVYADMHRRYGRYVAPAVTAQMAANTRSVVGPPPVEQQVVLLFADLRGFTSLSEGLSPRALINDVLNPYFSRMTEVILSYNGTVDKFLGDGIMAIFGLPAPRGDEPARAITAGLAMQAAFRALQQDWAARLGRDIGMGVGLAVGPAVVGTIGSPQRMDYTAIGSVVNLASRVTDLTPSGQVWATGDLKLLAETFVLTRPEAARAYPLMFRPLLPTAIKGGSGMQPLYACLISH
jgi:class 3 adenylate cyclase/DNA-binding response OmpR family regulator